MTLKTRTISMLTAATAITLAVPATAWACGGDGSAKHKQGRFQKADKNGDGFLTRTEVGAERWQKISVADGNKDAKISKAELMQAYRDGKLGKRGKNKQAKRDRGNS